MRQQEFAFCSENGIESPMRFSRSGLRLGLRAALAVLLVATVASLCKAEVTPLHEGWNLQSACKLESDGATISMTAFHPAGWIAISVPTTVLAAQVAAGIFKDPDYGTNMRSIPGTTYPIGANFANQPMAPGQSVSLRLVVSQNLFRPAADKGKTLWLRFAGINYRGNLWINGQKVVDDKVFQGAFTEFDFDVTKYLIAGRRTHWHWRCSHPRKPTWP